MSTKCKIKCAKVGLTIGPSGDISKADWYDPIYMPTGTLVVGGFINIKDPTTPGVLINVTDRSGNSLYAGPLDAGVKQVIQLTPSGWTYLHDDFIELWVRGEEPINEGYLELVVLYIK